MTDQQPMPAAPVEVRQPDGQDFVPPSELHFDRDNPRFVNLELDSEEEVIQELYDNVDVDELMQSIMSAGYIDFEPMIVTRADNVVLEGNRRLAALRLLADADLRRRLKISLPDVQNPKPLPERVRIRWVQDRAEARDFIGFKHINGPFKWDALAKAKYAAQWFEEGGDISAISRTLGDNHNTVRRLVNGWFVLQQALEDGFRSRSDLEEAICLFSSLHRANARIGQGFTWSEN